MSVHQKIATTERKIKAAFIYLVNEKGLSHITVKDITEAANINRSTRNHCIVGQGVTFSTQVKIAFAVDFALAG